MARLTLNKSALSQANKDLAAYRRFLPSLDLKRRQLIAERNKARRNLISLREKIDARVAHIGELVPMLADRDIILENLAEIQAVKIGEQNIVGTHLPILESIEVAICDYGYLVRPHWVDSVASLLKDVLTKRIEERIAQRRIELLDNAVRTITQRVNLFDKVLIPRTENHIRRIKIYLGDAERAAIVTSKIAKKKQAEAVAL